MIATAMSYVVSPAAMGTLAVDPERTGDRQSASYAIALAARVVRELGSLLGRASAQNKRLATLSIDTVISFKSAADRAEFARELTCAVTMLAARYHDDDEPGARTHRLVVTSYPAPKSS